MKQLYVYDIEVYKDCVLFGFIDPKTHKMRIFELSARRNNATSLRRFLTTRVKGLIGFNNLSYDNAIINYFLRTKIINPLKYYELSQKIINMNLKTPKLIPQLDVYKVNHWDNKARRTSLKAAEARMNFHNVADLPYAFDAKLKFYQIDKLSAYLRNDLEATLKVYDLFQDKYYLRSVMKREYDLTATNWSDSKIGEELLLKLLCERTGQDPDDVRKMRTHREKIKISDIIFDYVKFETLQLKELLKTIRKEVIVDTKGGFKHVFEYGGIETHLAQGGIHASKKGIFKNSDTHKIIDIDIAGMYPNIIIKNKLYPKHLGPVFYEVLDQEIVGPRMEIHKPGSKNKELHHKQRKSNDKYSFCYDPQMTMAVTINGQLSLLMLIEAIVTRLDVNIIQENTDGITFVVRKEDEKEFTLIIREWEKVTNLVMEYNYPVAIYQRDVNNYIWDFGTYTKAKGAYEVDKVVGSEPALHKDNSMKVVAHAVREYFTNDAPVEKTIQSHTNIYDFCITKRATKGWHFSMAHQPHTNPIKLRNIKTLRYYVSNSGSVVYKCHEDGRRNYLQAGLKGKDNKGHYWKLKLFNKFKEKENYNIDYSYYIREANKLINAIER